MKKIILFILAALILPSILAIDLQVEKQSLNEVMIMDINQPANFDLEITNLGPRDTFEFFNLWGFKIEPTKIGELNTGESKEINLKIYQRDDFNIRGFYTFSYSIKGTNTEKQNEELTFKVIDLENVFKIGVEKFDEEKNEVIIYIENKENFDFENITAEFSSAFFKVTKKFSLDANNKQNFKIAVDKSEFSKLKAGFYTMNAKIKVGNKNIEIEGIIEFEENGDINTIEQEKGFLINTHTIKKENNGNIIAKTQIKFTKNIISRLFTSLSVEPDIVERDDLKIIYIWERSIDPGKSFEVRITTNWTLPVIILILVAVIFYLVKFYSKKDLILKKKVTFIHAKGGEFALKVSILVQAKKYIEKVNIIDRLPMLARLYHKFGGTEPSRASEEKRRIDWNFEKLEAGEIRMLSYVIYSKIGVLGKFALPKVTGIYEDMGELKETQSNQTYFLAEVLRENESP